MQIETVKEQEGGGYLVNGSLSVPNSPGNRHYQAVQEWVSNGGTVEPYETTAQKKDRLKAEKKQAINSKRNERISMGVVFEGNTYDSDRDSIQNINGGASMAIAAKMAGQPFSIDWTLADNTTTVLDADSMIGLGVAVGQWVDANYNTARALKDELEALTTIKDIEAFDTNKDWPSQ